jgi:hypothetical protein
MHPSSSGDFTTMELSCPTRRFPPPWSVEELDACFVIKDDAGQKLAYVYFEEEPESLIDFFV